MNSGLSARLTARLLQIGAVAATVVLAWHITVVLLDLPAYILPNPGRVAGTLAANAGFLVHHGGITLIEILLGLLFGATLGVVTALSVSLFPVAGRVMLPVMIMSQALPVFAIAPLLVIWLGYGISSKVVMATLIIYFPVASAFLDGLRRTDPGLLDLARIARAGRLKTIALIRLPAALPGLASGLRVGAAVAPIGAVVGEWVGASAGLGYIMLHANARMQTDLVFAALLILALMAVTVRWLVDVATRRMVPWVEESAV
jgi:putative hydroxymethylpyrimidine transport system permease protein